MPRATYIQGPDGKLYEPSEHFRLFGQNTSRSPNLHAPMIMTDIQPYRSVIDGREISSRSAHRQHLREHGCVEVGNEWVPPKAPPEPSGIMDDLQRAYHATH